MVTLVLCLATLAVAAYLRGSPPGTLDQLLGGLDLLIVASSVCLIGLPALRLARSRGFVAADTAPIRSYLRIAILGAVLSVPAILIDVLGGFPADINIPLPEALVAYPAVAFVAELLFHVIPLGVLALLCARRTGSRCALVALAALPEPLLQVVWGATHSPLWANALVGLQLLVFNAVGLVVLRRHGLLAAYALRVGYYGIWHVLWGQWRLGLLFGI